MEQKRVSFKVAKAIKEAGYSQYNCRHWYSERGVEYEWYGCIEELESIKMDSDIDAPTYLEVWLWLWREKDIRIQPEFGSVYIWPIGIRIDDYKYEDLEEAIIAAIEYLVENDLIK